MYNVHVQCICECVSHACGCTCTCMCVCVCVCVCVCMNALCVCAGMELFASCLWHLHSDVELSVIAENLLNSDPRRVEGMCAKATSLNLARDHEGAVNCLQRAMSVSQE